MKNFILEVPTTSTLESLLILENFGKTNTLIFIYKDLSILFKKNNHEGVHLGDIKKVNDVWSVAGNTGYVIVMTGSGSTVAEARQEVYARLKNVNLQNMYYRTDIGLRWFTESDKLHTWGYLH